jgi:protein involved in polysaccharide export with SLBB domain
MKRYLINLFATLVFANVLSIDFSLAQSQNISFNQQAKQVSESANNERVDIEQFIARDGQQLAPSLSQGLQDDDEVDTLPYGYNLFSSGIEVSHLTGINPRYIISPGDKISVQMWGAISFSSVLTVDTQGNIFIPDVGPVEVGNTPAGELNQRVTSKIKEVYKQNVNIYINLLTSSPIGVFVTGAVLRPGQYAGLSSDPVLHYLKRAGGIDPERGSYRKINVLRQNKIVESFDLYLFLNNGLLNTFSFQDADVIFVEEQGESITVSGAAKNRYRFELAENEGHGKQLLEYAKPLPEASHVAISGDRETGPFSVYVALNEFQSFKLADGDSLLFNEDNQAQVLSVKVTGSHLGPSFYAVKTETRLQDFLANVEVNPRESDIGSIYIKRNSVAEKQAELLEESIRRLERSVLTAPASSEGEARIRVQEAQLIFEFIQRARQVDPIGKVVVSTNGSVANVRLEQGDEIVIPEKTDLIQVSGEVLIPQAIVYDEDFTLADYIKSAGGFTNRSNKDKIAIIHANGLVTFSSLGAGGHWLYEGKTKLVAGDQILVLPAVDNKLLQAVKDITQIIFQIAVAANVAIN